MIERKGDGSRPETALVPLEPTGMSISPGHVIEAMRSNGVWVAEEQTRTIPDPTDNDLGVDISRAVDLLIRPLPSVETGSTPHNPDTKSYETSETQYLDEIARIPLLTADAEVSLSKQLEAGDDARRRLESELISENERIELEARAKAGDEARRRLMESNLRLVVSVARKYMGRGLPFLDLVQEGNIGLDRGIEKYDWRRGFRFSTYAYWWIRQAITRAVADQSRIIRIPVHIFEEFSKLSIAEREFEQTFHCLPTEEKLAESIDSSPKYVRDLRNWMREPLSLDTPIDPEEEGTRVDLIEDKEQPTVVDQAAHRLLREQLDNVLGTLSRREQIVMRLRFGLVADGRQRSLSKIAEDLRLSRERVRQIEAEALTKLRHPSLALRLSRLRDYLD